jgi:hypothetical protein
MYTIIESHNNNIRWRNIMLKFIRFGISTFSDDDVWFTYGIDTDGDLHFLLRGNECMDKHGAWGQLRVSTKCKSSGIVPDIKLFATAKNAAGMAEFWREVDNHDRSSTSVNVPPAGCRMLGTTLIQGYTDYSIWRLDKNGVDIGPGPIWYSRADHMEGKVQLHSFGTNRLTVPDRWYVYVIDENDQLSFFAHAPGVDRFSVTPSLDSNTKGLLINPVKMFYTNLKAQRAVDFWQMRADHIHRLRNDNLKMWDDQHHHIRDVFPNFHGIRHLR